jgi:hypothetical protein
MNNDQSSALSVFRLFAGVLGWTAIIVQVIASLMQSTDANRLTTTVDYFSFFTVLSNILVATAFTVPTLAGRSRVGRFLLIYELRTAFAVYMIATGGVYATLLAGLKPLTEVQYVADIALHYVIPPLYLIDWILIRPERRMDWKNVLYFLIFPLLYGIYTLVRGALIGTYPYPFIDVTELGYRTVLVNFGLFVGLFTALSLIVVAIGRARAPRRAPARSCDKEALKV